jgi:predicted nucleic acid-binding protein
MTQPSRATQDVIIDTSSWIELFRKDGRPEVQQRVGDLMRNGRAAMCEFVRLELWRGVRGEDERRRLEEIEALVKNYPTDSKAWDVCIRLSKAALAKGHRPPAADVVIAGTAKRHGLSVEHVDRHLAVLLEID